MRNGATPTDLFSMSANSRRFFLHQTLRNLAWHLGGSFRCIPDSAAEGRRHLISDIAFFAEVMAMLENTPHIDRIRVASRIPRQVINAAALCARPSRDRIQRNYG